MRDAFSRQFYVCMDDFQVHLPIPPQFVKKNSRMGYTARAYPVTIFKVFWIFSFLACPEKEVPGKVM